MDAVSHSCKNGQKKAAKSGMKRKHTRTRKLGCTSGWIRHAQKQWGKASRWRNAV